MTVYAVMPVFNRLQMTRCMLECLQAQVLGEPLRVIVVDDGSTDGTAEFLAGLDAITVLRGDGSLWWGGAMDLALRHLLPTARPDDWVLLLNNDTEIRADFVQALLDVACCHPRSVIGSVVRNKADGKLLSIGPTIDATRMTTQELLQPGHADISVHGVCAVDVLSGRGLLLPVEGLLAAGGMRPRWLPHYLADYELTVRLKARGWALLVALDVPVYSENHFGSEACTISYQEKFLSIRSPSYLPALLAFWWQASSWLQRLTLPVRMVLFLAFPALRRK